MHLVFIRHGDPDYKNNTLTEKGFREAGFLAERAESWKVTQYFVSPYGRARHTMDAITKRTGQTAVVKEWLHEFDFLVTDPATGRKKMPWDWMPRYFFGEKQLSGDNWFNHPVMKEVDQEKNYKAVCDGFDEIMLSYGYKKEKDSPLYLCTPHLTEEEAAVDTHLLASQKDYDDRTLVFVCHLGVMFVLISHLTGISPISLCQGMFVAPTSVTTLGAEERKPGEVIFRLQQLGDIRHLTCHNEPPSASGYFGNFTVF